MHANNIKDKNGVIVLKVSKTRINRAGMCSNNDESLYRKSRQKQEKQRCRCQEENFTSFKVLSMIIYCIVIAVITWTTVLFVA